jgi:signal transduction histidine kinase
MSHEIRTPLNGVIGMAELLIRKGGLAHRQRRYVDVIKSSGDSLLTLINTVLDFSKIEAGKLELNRIDFNLRSVVEDVIEMLAPKAAAKKLEFRLPSAQRPAGARARGRRSSASDPD